MTSSHKPRRSRKASALIAATAVLGVATVGTLATWTVTEYVSSTFRTVPEPQGSIEASVDGVTFSAHHTMPSAATANWSADPLRMVKNQTIVAPYYLRTTPGTLKDVPISVDYWFDVSDTSLLPITMGFYVPDSVDTPCTEELALLSTQEPAPLVPDLSASTLDTPGTPQKLCLVFKTDQASNWDSQLTMFWQFTGKG